MDDCSPKFFESIRRQLLKIPIDDLHPRLEKVHMRNLAIEALKICEVQAEQLMGGDPDDHEICTARLQKLLERFSSQMA